MKRSLLLLCSLGLACTTSASGDEDPRPNEEGSESTEGTSESESTSEASSESEESTGGMDLPPEAPRPEFASPAEAEDLDPDPDVVRVELTAAPYEYEVDGETIQGYAYNGQVPGPTIRAKHGDTVIIDFQNELGMPTTVHWHGLHVPFEMDGVTWMGSAVESGEGFQYSFTVEQSGSYWYHPHFDTAHQADLGLYGAFIVEDPDDPPVDEELVMLLDGWGENEAPDIHHEGSLLNWTINGLVDPVHRPAAGSTLRLRVIDVANAGYVQLEWPAMRRIGSDQGLLPSLDEPGKVILSPGDRVDAELSVGSQTIDLLNHEYSLFGPVGGEPYRLMSIEPEGSARAPAPLDWPFSETLPSPDPGYADIVYTLMGDTDAGAWSINGELFPDVTIESVDLGDEAIIEVRNISASQHPFHLHGYAFEVLSRNDEAPLFAELEDTINVDIAETVRLRILADNPGDWMAHCHILQHAEEGMMTVLRVE